MEVAHLKHEGREMDRQITKGEMDLKELVCADVCQIFAHIFFSQTEKLLANIKIGKVHFEVS